MGGGASGSDARTDPGTPATDASGWRGGLAAWAALVLLAIAIRPLIYGVTPLLPDVQAELEATFAVTSLLVSLPVLCLGLASLAAPWLAGRLGVRPTAALALGLMVGAGMLRAVLPSIEGILLASLPLGAGAGVAGVLLPMLVKATVPARLAAAATGVYTVGMQLGGALTASVAVPLAVATGGWRPAFVTIGVFSALAVAAWLVLSRSQSRTAALHAPVVESSSAGSLLPKMRLLAATVTVFSLLVLLFQGLNSWLPTLYVELGWSAADAGQLLAVMVFAQVPGTLAAGYLADRFGQRRNYLIVPGLVLGAVIVLLVLNPSLAYGWAIVAGLAMGFIAPVTLVIALDFGADIAEVGRSTAVIFGVGYVVASLSPLAMGVLRDLTGSFELGMLSLSLLAVLIAASALAIPPRTPATDFVKSGPLV